MARKPLLRLAAAALGGFAAATALLAVTLVVNAGGGFSGTTAATPLGWTIPLIAGILVGGLSWLLLSDRETRSRAGDPPQSIACASCGKTCLDSWRLCPFCGTLLRDRADQG